MRLAAKRFPQLRLRHSYYTVQSALRARSPVHDGKLTSWSASQQTIYCASSGQMLVY